MLDPLVMGATRHAQLLSRGLGFLGVDLCLAIDGISKCSQSRKLAGLTLP